MQVLQQNSSTTAMPLKKMVDMAFGNPEIGSVNFNVLHTLLHAMLKALNMQDIVIDLNKDSLINFIPEQRESDDHSNLGSVDKQSIVVTSTPLHNIQDRLRSVECQLNNLNALPTTEEIMQSSTIGSSTDPSKHNVSDMWQMLNVRKKVDTHDEGIDRLSSLIDSILKELQQLKSENEQMKHQLEDLNGLKNVGNKIAAMEGDLAKLLDDFKNLLNRINEYPSPDSLKKVVTWDALENALKGIREDMNDLRKPTERIVVNMATEPMSRPPTPDGPSKACAEMLEKIGQLSDAHNSLEKRVDGLEVEMPNKADKSDLENLKIPDDLLKTINQLKAQVESMMASKNRDSEALARIRDILNGLQDKVNAFNNMIDKLTTDNKDMLQQLEKLFGITNDQESRKADLNYVDGQLKMKADKTLLDSKVNYALFDETTGNLHNLIDDVLKKLLAAEEELRNLLNSLAGDIACKVESEDLEALKQWIEKRLKALAEKLKNMKGIDMSEDDAAGLRKQLLQHFHCISCDRPVDMAAQGLPYGVNLPDPKGLPPNKSIRPYTTFELDAIRQHAKTLQDSKLLNPKYFSYGTDIIDVYQTPRPCGGSHTTTLPFKRMNRNFNNAFLDEEVPVARPYKEELDLQGSDGHIYKGRFDRNLTAVVAMGPVVDLSLEKLPPVGSNQRSYTVVQNTSVPAKGGFVTSRPRSAVKLTPRPATAGSSVNSRVSSAKPNFPDTGSRPATPTKINVPIESEDPQIIINGVKDLSDNLITTENLEIEVTTPENQTKQSDETVLS